MRCVSCLKEFEGSVCPHCGYPEVPQNKEHQLPVGTLLRGRYQVGKVLGQGGFGITYLAWDTLMGSAVAVKEFFPGGTVYRRTAVSNQVECVTGDAVPHYEYSKERFLREARALVQFKDIPEVVDIQDFVEENNTAYIIMEYVRGVDLAKYIQRKGGRLTVEETFRILKPVMEALAKVHKGGIVHRDISPDNIILDPMGGAKLLDFGAVRAVENPDMDKGLNKSTEAILKQGFAPMEQYNTRGSLGPWTDEYAMCASIWYCLTGRVPEDASIRITEGIDPDWSSIPGLPEYQQAALRRGFACRPRDRFPDMDGLLAALFPPVKPEIPAEPKPAEVPAPKPEPVKKAEKPAAPVKKAEKPAAPAKTAGGRKKGLLLGALAGAAAAAVLALAVIPRLAPVRYSRAQGLMEAGDFEKAAAAFESLGDYEDSEKQADRCAYRLGESLMEQGSYEEAALVFEGLAGYSDSTDQASLCRYYRAEELMGQGSYEEAAQMFAALGSFSDSPQMYRRCRNELDYPRAVALMEQGSFEEAAALFEEMGDYLDSPENLTFCRNRADYDKALGYQEEGKYYDAAVLYYSLGAFEDARDRCFDCWDKIARRETLDTNVYSAAALRTDGTVMMQGLLLENLPEETGSWRDIIAIRYAGGTIAGLRADGTVVVAGSYGNGQFDVSGWRDIVAIDVCVEHIVGLKADGTLVMEGYFGTGYWDEEKWVEGAYEIPDWTGLVDIQTNGDTWLGLKADGTVVLAGSTSYKYYEDGWGYREVPYDISGWTDIVSICASGGLYGVRADGTVLTTGVADQIYGNVHIDVSGWRDIVAVRDSGYHVVGLKADGTVVAMGTSYGSQCDVSGWEDIVAVCADTGYKPDMAFTLGLKADGTVILVGDSRDGRYRFLELRNIAMPNLVNR